MKSRKFKYNEGDISKSGVKFIKCLGTKYRTSNSKKKHRFGVLLCYCGKEFEAVVSDVLSGRVKSCGCLNKESITKHGLRNTRLYRIFHGMKRRCYNKNDEDYKYYGNKGVKIAQEWLDNFVNFYTWALENGYKDTFSIERKDVYGDYSPDNCTWVTVAKQRQNIRSNKSNNTSGYKGVFWNKKNNNWRVKIGNNGKCYEIGSFKDKEEAVRAYDLYIIENNLYHSTNFPREVYNA